MRAGLARISIVHMSDYDHIIVGSGPAGCALAARLTEDLGRRVLLLEAGGPARGMNISTPAAFSKLFKSRHDWGLETAPQDGLDGRRVYFPRGKVLGGCSSTNAQMYVRGHRVDYDSWGLPGWSYDELLPYFRRVEDNERGADAFHGADGPWHIADQRDPNPLSTAFVQAALEVGIAPNPDFNGAALDGAGLVQVSQRAGRRFGAVDAYLRPARRRANLEIATDARATKLLLEAGRAVGVAYRRGRSRHLARAVEGVVLCAGVIGSPHLLMLSGIGPEQHLSAHGIRMVEDLPGVGRNLQDHLGAPTLFATDKPLSLLAAESPRALLRYLTKRRGLLTSNVGEAAAFVRSSPELEAPDLELLFAPVMFAAEGLEPPARHGFTIGVLALQPRSRGGIALASGDPLAAPVIRPNYLSHPHDLQVMARGVGIARHIASARAFEELCDHELEPGPGATGGSDLENWIRSRAHTLYHPVGTCRMGTDELAVVDPELRVRGVEGLHVADASVIPTIVRGHTAAIATVIGERAADLVLGRGAGILTATRESG